MRPPRIFILALFSAACLFLLCRAITSVAQPAPATSLPRSTTTKSAFRSFFSFTTPFTLFPPNAIITIADDNSTSFAARPAAFGPALPAKGLNGQLWVGSGFSEETTVNGEGEGELGCSDVPGWNDGSSISALKPQLKEVQGKSASTTEPFPSKKWKRNISRAPIAHRSTTFKSEPKSKKTVNDGTDDYLHQHLDKSQRLASDTLGSSGTGHADIQSIQEGAEIAGKIVLLSRGGCGFLEKVKWAQRRGAIGLIVGDNRRGGPLIQMYAHGDTSNVSIPSIFTSRTTAYLLSLMMQPGSFIEDIIDDSGKPIQKVQQYDKSNRNKGTTLVGSSAHSVKPPAASRSEKAAQTQESRSESPPTKPGWFSRFFGSSPRSKASLEPSDSTRGGQLDWVLVEDFSDEKDRSIKNGLDQASKSKGSASLTSNTRQPVTDDFQIGVEDWRDPDLVGMDKSESITQDNSKSTQAQPKPGRVHSADKHEPNGPGHADSIPSNADYATSHMPSKGTDAIGLTKEKSVESGSTGLISKIFKDDGELDTVGDKTESSPDEPPFIGKPGGIGAPPPPSEREGLWVVVTPTSGASPFFDTLLVLVISPLITLTMAGPQIRRGETTRADVSYRGVHPQPLSTDTVSDKYIPHNTFASRPARPIEITTPFTDHYGCSFGW
ncbi:hypothetical protein ONZ43_g994 [Nemania bipapillata]|uniref:Uncharacterized protein n=1 Tax=Nemania bipapillata TaxID=110536 RepID=A0ACC2J692_9PEZI|nr:hypothetical protein ONZ43_g994 [Nemania bipapillata]